MCVWESEPVLVQVWAWSCSVCWLGRLSAPHLWGDGAGLLLRKRRPKIQVDYNISRYFTCVVLIFSLTYCLPPIQLSRRPTETTHLRHRPDQAHLHAASLRVQGDPGAAALLRGQEEPNHRSNKDQPNLQQGQLCLTHTWPQQSEYVI